MSDARFDPTAVFALVMRAWQGGDPAAVLDLITEDYIGHMLHLPNGERTASMYPEWIARYRNDNRGTVFEVKDQAVVGDQLWTRFMAREQDGSTAHGMNVSRFVAGQLAEEWAVWSAWHPPQ